MCVCVCVLAAGVFVFVGKLRCLQSAFRRRLRVCVIAYYLHKYLRSILSNVNVGVYRLHSVHIREKNKNENINNQIIRKRFAKLLTLANDTEQSCQLKS